MIDVDEILNAIPEPAPRIPRALPRASTGERRIDRARKYLSRMDPAIQGQNGSVALFSAVCRMMHGFDLDDSEVRGLIADDYNPRCDPPWSEIEIEHKISDARSKADAEKWRVEDREPVAAVASVVDHPKPVTPRWRRCRDLVDTILERANDPMIAIALGGPEICRVRVGGIATLIGGTGRGKSSMAVTMLVEHARDHGPAIGCSIELPGDEWTARAIGTQCDASWPDTLCGRVPREQMLAALPERLAVIEREHASMEALAEAIDAMRAAYPGQPILVAVDYVQLIELAGDTEIRVRIGQVMRAIDKLARSRRVVVIALSQGSRMSARALSDGSRIGSDTTDSGAESADLERWATATIAIGALGPEGEDGSCPVEISLGKSRMGRGDVVFPGRYHGRSGLWRIDGEARAATDVRAERATQREGKRSATAVLAIAQLLGKSSAPMYANGIRTELGIERGIVYAALRELREAGQVVRVRGKRKGGAWPVWTPEHASKAALDVVPEGMDE